MPRCSVAVDRDVAPELAARAGDALLVQSARRSPAGDCRRRSRGRCGGRSAASRRVDLALAADRLAVGVELLHHLVAVAEAAAGLARLDPAAQAAPGLVGEVLQEERVHRALEADMQLADLALGEGDDLHVRRSVSRLKSAAMSAWSRLMRSSASASTMSNCAAPARPAAAPGCPAAGSCSRRRSPRSV